MVFGLSLSYDRSQVNSETIEFLANSETIE